jgi:dihydroxy-acid dehydratase
MVRLSDARMSGSSYGACVLHVAPESYVGGPLALLRSGDIVKLDIPNRSIDMLVGEDELVRRRESWRQPRPKAGRGYNWIYAQHIEQADMGCDFDFLRRSFGTTVKEPDIY